MPYSGAGSLSRFSLVRGACPIAHGAARPVPVPVFSGANAMTLLLYFALGGILFFLPFDLIGSRAIRRRSQAPRSFPSL